MLKVFEVIMMPLKYSSVRKLHVVTLCHAKKPWPRKIPSDSFTGRLKPCIIEYNFSKVSGKLFSKRILSATVDSRISHVRLFHTSDKRNATPVLILIVLRPFAKLAAILFGRTLRKWWQALPPDRKEKVLDKINMYKAHITGLLAVLTASMMHYYFSHLQQDPITRRWRFIMFSREQMIQIADLELDVLVEEYKDMFLRGNDLQYRRVVNVANRILIANRDVVGLSDTNWRVTVVDHPTVKNAFVLPNGTIFIFTAMLDLCDNDDQLGVVLAHEMSHALLSHMAEQMSSVHLIEWLMLIPLVIMWALLPDGAALFSQWVSGQFASLLFHLPFSRYIETEADRVGLHLTAKACFDVREATVFWNKMALFQESDGDTSQVEWFSTHPSHFSRESFLDSIMPEVLKLREKCNCPRLSENDPRAVWKTAKSILLRAKIDDQDLRPKAK